MSSHTTTLFSLSPKARSALYMLLHTAAETLVDGTYHLDERTRRQGQVQHAGIVLHEFSKALGKRLLNDNAELEQRLADIACAFDNLDALNVDPAILMFRRDYATQPRRKRADKLRANQAAIDADQAAIDRAIEAVQTRRNRSLRLRLVTDDE
jgi:hypothetical protein